MTDALPAREGGSNQRQPLTPDPVPSSSIWVVSPFHPPAKDTVGRGRLAPADPDHPAAMATKAISGATTSFTLPLCHHRGGDQPTATRSAHPCRFRPAARAPSCERLRRCQSTGARSAARSSRWCGGCRSGRMPTTTPRSSEDRLSLITRGAPHATGSTNGRALALGVGGACPLSSLLPVRQVICSQLSSAS
jgi:hypothetical protein